MGKKKTYSTVSSDKLSDYLKDNQTSVASFAYEIGVSQGCVSKWLSEDRMPQYMGVMIDALNAKREPASKALESAFIVSGKPEAIGILMATAEQMQLQTLQIEV